MKPGTSAQRDILEAATELKGPKTAAKVLYEMKPKFKIQDDHQLAHIIGRSTAKYLGNSGESFSHCPTDFSYGCIHGFFENAITKTTLPEKALTTICETYNDTEIFAPLKRGNCYHGGGHGILMNENYDLKKALKICGKLPKEVKSHCWSGAFMENVLGFLANRIPEEKVTFKDDDLLAPCNSFTENIQIKERECWLFQHEYLIAHHNLTFNDLKNVCSTAKNAESECFKGLSRNFMGKYYFDIAKDVFQEHQKRNENNYNNIFEICNLYPRKFIYECHQYAIHYIIANVSPETPNSLESAIQKTLEYCALFNNQKKQSECFNEINKKIEDLIKDKEYKTEIQEILKKKIKVIK